MPRKPSATSRTTSTRDPKKRTAPPSTAKRPGGTAASTPSPGDAIRRARSAGKVVGIQLPRAPKPLPLPAALAGLLADALDAHANGHRVELVVHTEADATATASSAPCHYLILDRDPNDELTTQQAAAALRVSRPTIIKAIEEGRLAARLIGKHRRVRIYDFNAYARAEHAARVAHAIESDRLEQEEGLYDIPLPQSMEDWKRGVGRTTGRLRKTEGHHRRGRI